MTAKLLSLKCRPSLTKSSTGILVHTVDISHIDYCYALLIGLPTKLSDRLQIIPSKSTDQINPVLINFHWPPVQYCFQDEKKKNSLHLPSSTQSSPHLPP